MFKLPFHRYAISALCCASTSILVACGGGGSTASDTGASQTPATSTAASQSASTNTTQVAAVEATTIAPSAVTGSNTGAAAATPVAPFGQSADQYKLTFSDEFNSSYNSNVWNDHIWYEGSDATKNYTVEDGKLKIWPQRNASGQFVNRTIDTDGKFYQTYGYFEMEAKLPMGAGTWPAFWLLNHDNGDRPEIDILEAYGGAAPNTGWSDGAGHPTTYSTTVWPTGIQTGDQAGFKMIQNLGDLSAGFHKYGVKWEPNKLTFYYDGKEVYSVNVSMSRRMYILLDLWYGSASGNPNDSTPTGKGNSYEVNYVRAWQFK